MIARVALLLVAGLLLAGCGGGGSSSSSGAANGPVVKFTGTAFEPSTLTIKAGDTVTFENKSGDDFWPASNVHPTHLLYPGFDAKKPILDGGTYSFTFTKKGSWGYHNHLTPDIQGTIVVQ